MYCIGDFTMFLGCSLLFSSQTSPSETTAVWCSAFWENFWAMWNILVVEIFERPSLPFVCQFSEAPAMLYFRLMAQEMLFWYFYSALLSAENVLGMGCQGTFAVCLSPTVHYVRGYWNTVWTSIVLPWWVCWQFWQLPGTDAGHDF